MQESRFYRFIKPILPPALRPLVLKYQELVSYVLFGGMTTLVNLALYFPLSNLMNYLIANVIAWVGAVLFAFLTNKAFVFENHRWDLPSLLAQAGGFALARLLSLGLEEGILILFVETLHCSTGLTKLAAQVIVVAVNYFASKFVIFKKQHKE